jgi:hypothetical protein
MMAAARTLLQLDARDRELYLFDTFEGMPGPEEHDVDRHGERAADILARSGKDDPVWAVAFLAETEAALLSTGYPGELVHFVPGLVEETIPANAPERIALLRLDTDWYRSTRHELEHLYPRLSLGGVLIIDDYGHWRGAQRAVDEYLREHELAVLLNRIDYSGRMGVKT